MIFSYRCRPPAYREAFWKKLVFRDGSKNSRKLHCSKIRLCNLASIPSTVPLIPVKLWALPANWYYIEEQAALGNKAEQTYRRLCKCHITYQQINLCETDKSPEDESNLRPDLFLTNTNNGRDL
jgi:hypothetical protein